MFLSFEPRVAPLASNLINTSLLGLSLGKSQIMWPLSCLALPQTPHENYEFSFSSQHIPVTLDAFT